MEQLSTKQPLTHKILFFFLFGISCPSFDVSSSLLEKTRLTWYFSLQVYELNNCGAVPVRYEVDVTALARLKVDNFNHPVLVCLNPEGTVLPGKTAMLEWIFSPLEAKMYHVRIM